MEQTDKSHSSGPRRPLGVWLLTIYAVVAVGIIPIVLLVAARPTGLNLSGFNIQPAHIAEVLQYRPRE